MLLPDVGWGAGDQEVASVEIYADRTPFVSDAGVVSNRMGIPWYTPNELVYLARRYKSLLRRTEGKDESLTQKYRIESSI